METTKKLTVYPVRLPRYVANKLKKKAKQEKRKMHWIMVNALTEYVNQK